MVAIKPLLEPTLQSLYGMVLNEGESTWRQLPDIIPDILSTGDFKTLSNMATSVTSVSARVNLETCAQKITASDLLAYIKASKRLDVEQAAAMVIACLRSDEETVAKLVQTIPSFFVETCMWREKSDFELQSQYTPEAAQMRYKNRLLQQCSAVMYTKDVDLVTLLKRIRRNREALGHAQRLCIPTTLIGSDDSVWQQPFYKSQSKVKVDRAVVVPKTMFKRLQSWLSRLDLDMDPKSVFLRDSNALFSRFNHGNPIDHLDSSKDIYAVAYNFMHIQRVLQRKIVSDYSSTDFLKKNEGSTLIQNRPDLMTTFEEVLVKKASDVGALCAYNIPEGVINPYTDSKDVLENAKDVCLMMQRYVKVFGAGKYSNLTFKKGDKGGGNRGPVNTYNKLVDTLYSVKLHAKSLGIPLEISCRKFLAKDIMQWNNSWHDDAFAPDHVPGWETYLLGMGLQDLDMTSSSTSDRKAGV